MMTKAKDIEVLDSSIGIVNWDLETYMPPSGIQLRSEQLSLLDRLSHEMISSPQIGDLLNEVRKSLDAMSEVQRRNIHLLQRDHDIATRIPAELVGRLSKQKAIATDIWKKAKTAKDWKMFEPELKKLVELSREREEIAMEVKGIDSLYDSMLDDFERGLSADVVSKVFRQLRDRLVPLAERCAEPSKDVSRSFLSKRVPIDVQTRIAVDIGNLIGYDTTSDTARGRIDPTEHPFTTGYFDDVRVTLHYYENNVSAMIYAMLHEGGHALYEQNLNREFMYQPVGTAASFGIHESMSRFYENMIGRTPEFWGYYLPRLNEITSGTFADVDQGEFVKGTTLVRPSKVRIEADEVTYSLHIIIRFEIERELLAEKLTVSELPQVWNEKYEKYLGVQVKHDGEGVLQDTHWGSGLYGYFPSYALGNVYDGQWALKLGKDVPDWGKSVSEGDLDPVNRWLVDNIQSKGALYDPEDLVKLITGNQLDARPFLDYLERKYSRLLAL